MGNNRSKQKIVWTNETSTENVAYVSTMAAGKVIEAKAENTIGFNSDFIKKVEIKLSNNETKIITKQKNIQGPSRYPYHMFAGMPDWLTRQAPAVTYASNAKYFTFYVDSTHYGNNQITTIIFYEGNNGKKKATKYKKVATFEFGNSISNRASSTTSLKF